MRLLEISIAIAMLSGCASQATGPDAYKRDAILSAVSAVNASVAHADKCGDAQTIKDANRTALSTTMHMADRQGVQPADISRASLRGRDRAAELDCSPSGRVAIAEALERSTSWLDTVAKRDASRIATQSARDRAYAECRHQSDLALANTRNFVDRVSEGASLIRQCMTLKGVR